MIQRMFGAQRRPLTLFLATAIAVTGAFATAGGVGAAAPTPQAAAPIPVASVPAGGQHLTAAQVALANQTLGFLSQKGIRGEFSVVNGALTLKDPLPTIRAKYSLTAAQVKTIQSILAADRQRVAAGTTSTTGTVSTNASSGAVSPNVFANGTVIYFTFSDTGGLLLTAAAAGPWAILAALDRIASLFGGPVGTIIGLVLSVVSFGTLAQFGYAVLQAYSKHEGVYIGITWNWFWPNPVQGTWCGCN